MEQQEKEGYLTSSSAFADYEQNDVLADYDNTGNMPNSSYWSPPQSEPKVREQGACILLYVFTLSLYQFYWLYVIHKELPSRSKDLTHQRVLYHLLLVPTASIFVAVLLGFSIESINPEAGSVFVILLIGVVAFAFLYYMVWSVIIYARLSERINELAPRRLRQRSDKVVNKSYATVAILSGWIPYLGTMVAITCWVIWWNAAQIALNHIARGDDVDDLAEVFE